jgi:hypothetical protein
VVAGPTAGTTGTTIRSWATAAPPNHTAQPTGLVSVHG